MKSPKLDGPALLCLGLGSTLLSLVAFKEPLTSLLALTARIWSIGLITGAIFSLLGIFLGVISTIINAKQPAQSVFERVVLRPHDAPCFVRHARSSDLTKLHKQYKKEFGDDVPSTDLMRSWLDRCESSFTLLYRGEKARNLSVALKFLGSFKLLPLTKEGVEALLRGQASGSTFKPEHVCATDEDAADYYVGDLFANGVVARAVILSHLDTKCRELTARGFTIYARPFTIHGRRVMTNCGFVQVSNGKEDLEMRKLCRLSSQPSVPGPIPVARSNNSNKAA